MMVSPAGTITLPEVNPVAVPPTAIAVTVPPDIYTAASKKKGLVRDVPDAGIEGAVCGPVGL